LTPIFIKSFFGWGFASDPTGSLQRSPGPLASFRGPAYKGRGGERRGEEGHRMGGKRRRGEGLWLIPSGNCSIAPF